MNAIKEKPCTTDDVLNLLEIISLQQNTIKDQEKNWSPAQKSWSPSQNSGLRVDNRYVHPGVS